MLKKVLVILVVFGFPVGALATVALVDVPGSTVIYTPDQIGAALNYIINAINTQSITCTTTGCSGTGTPSAVPVLSGLCSTAGGATSSLAGNAFSGRVTCTSTANTSGTLTWAVARLTQPVCTIVGETTAVTTITANSTTVLTWNYASTVSPIFDYVCIGN
jgi:hypothetical protein